MSKGYMEGHNMDASVINCALKFTDQAMRYTRAMVHEMAPFTNSTHYCFYINDNSEPHICSGSKTIHTSYGPFNSSNEWKFRMQLTNNAIQKNGEEYGKYEEGNIMSTHSMFTYISTLK